MQRSCSATDALTEHPTIDAGSPWVEVWLPADPAYLRVARLVSGDMALRAGFSIDELSDVRLAIDEVCAILISAGGCVVELRLQVRGRALFVEGRTRDAKTPAAPSVLSDTLLGALVDSYHFLARDREDSFEMTKRARDLV